MFAERYVINFMFAKNKNRFRYDVGATRDGCKSPSAMGFGMITAVHYNAVSASCPVLTSTLYIDVFPFLFSRKSLSSVLSRSRFDLFVRLLGVSETLVEEEQGIHCLRLRNRFKNPAGEERSRRRSTSPPSASAMNPE